MNDLWNVHDVPVSLLPWFLGQSWCLSQSPEGVPTICWAMHPDQHEWTVDEMPAPPNPMNWTRSVQIWKHVFRVDHEKREIVWVRTEEPAHAP